MTPGAVLVVGDGLTPPAIAQVGSDPVILGVDVVVEKVSMTRSGQIVAICRRDKIRQRIGILDLPLPTPAPAGTEWIAAYRHWRREF